MCNEAVLEFFVEKARPEEFSGKRILEVGSRYVNGSVRPFIERFLSPKEYVGVDIEPGKFVDLILPAEKLVDYLRPESFDVVIATELLEHVRDWRTVVSNMKSVLKRGGHMYITTRSKGFLYHGYPSDYWRFDPNDMRRIFMDFEIIDLEKDSTAPGVLAKVRKPEDYVLADLSDVSLYSIVLGRRTRHIPTNRDALLTRRLMFRLSSSRTTQRVSPGILMSRIKRATA